MKKNRMLLILILVLFLCLGVAGGYLVTHANMENLLSWNVNRVTDTYQWEIRDGVAVIMGIGRNEKEDIQIPAQIYLSEIENDLVEDPLWGTVYPVAVCSDAFAGCTSIKRVSFAEGVSIVGEEMHLGETGIFSDCRNLVSVSGIPNDVVSMDYAFTNCTSLRELDRFPEQVTSLVQCFYGCSSLESVPTFSDGITDMEKCFFNCTKLVAVPELPKKLVNMNSTFSGCTALQIVEGKIPAGVWNMNCAFSGCASLQVAPELPESITVLSGTFSDCSSLVHVPGGIPESVDNLYRTFYGCSSLITAPELPQSVVSLDSTFMDCTSLTQLEGELPKSVETMYCTFRNCTSMTVTPVLPEGVVDLTQTFMGCTALKTVTGPLPESIEVMHCTFEACTALTDVAPLPASVEDLTTTFDGCSSLRAIEVNTCPMDRTKMPEELEITRLLKHISEGLCIPCSNANGWFRVDELEVYFDDLTIDIYEGAVDYLTNRIPEIIRDSCDKLYFIQEKNFADYVGKKFENFGGRMTGTYHVPGNAGTRAYIKIPNIQPLREDTITWILAREYITIHELAHAYDFRYGYWAESTTDEWDSVHNAEGQLLAKKLYSYETYSGYSAFDQQKETYAMATEGYFYHARWLKENCPQAYAYMDEQWGRWMADHPAT